MIVAARERRIDAIEAKMRADLNVRVLKLRARDADGHYARDIASLEMIMPTCAR